MYIQVCKPMIDYLTVTTFNLLLARRIRETAVSNLPVLAQRKAQRMQYSGAVVATDRGTVFFGSGRQRNNDHYIIQCSSAVADSMHSIAADAHRAIGGSLNVTRIDLQVTVPYGRAEWSQQALFLRIKDAGQLVCSYVESKAKALPGMLATVYAGSWHSDRKARIYEKQGLGDEVFLRFEVEYKAARARELHGMLLNGSTIAGVLAAELERINDDALSAIFAPCLADAPASPVRVVRGPTGSESWICETAIPAIRKYLTLHDDDGTVRQQVEGLYEWMTGIDF